MALIATVLEEGLEDEGGGDLIDYIAVFLAGAARMIEDLMGLMAGEALVPEVDGESGEGPEFGGEGLGLLGARAGFSGEVEGVADDDAGDGELAGEAGDGAEVVAGIAADLKGHDGLGSEAQFVRDGYPNALGADVERQKSRFGGSFHK